MISTCVPLSFCTFIPLLYQKKYSSNYTKMRSKVSIVGGACMLATYLGCCVARWLLLCGSKWGFFSFFSILVNFMSVGREGTAVHSMCVARVHKALKP